MPISESFAQRLETHLERIVVHFGTPFHIYDEAGIRDTGEHLKQAFAALPGFREYFAVKALPNPAILHILQSLGFGFDCSSEAELVLARQIGAQADDILFTSNNTSTAEFQVALADGGCILNLDDIRLLGALDAVPELICFRYNPGERRDGNAIIGTPSSAKFGVAHHQLIEAYRRAQALGATRFGLHTMIVSNERDVQAFLATAEMLLAWADVLERECGIRLEFINMGGGFGIPYQPVDTPLNLEALSAGIKHRWQAFADKHGYMPRLLLECGRYITGPFGALITRVINIKETYRRYVGVDASMSALMRPGMYGAYHHITVHGKQHLPSNQVVDVVGALCENNDKFAIQRPLPPLDVNDLLIIHDTGAHGHAMGFNYNGRLRPQELLLHLDGRVSRIRRAETLQDYFATLTYDPDLLP